ncbi:ester cyclase [Chryseobacterium sediminis]|uniref:nuclear transport factor 2 family protein n=1 Tax=Chryseobacterium sediminis TaxID=1679494 RepID=UPI0028599337|nr:ester cyclase [Chryseobacterium sediminis]MDR6466141.1 putative SnoaL-like aldol condensation-catalyzing enzyme [Chryseobacterium sediminis]
MRKNINKIILSGLILSSVLCFAQNIQTKIDCPDIEQAQKNKEIVLSFYQQMFGDKDISAVDRYVDKNYIQHNPRVADGADAFKKAAETWFKGAEKVKVDVQHVAAEGDFVFVHIKNKNKDGSLKSTMDIFRIHDGKIMEHWDVHENVPQTSANPHPMF